jgi:hypothetical protein
MQARRPPSYARPFVIVFLCALVACALWSVEAWPFTAWRLFSTLRTDEQHGWAATVVSHPGGERDFPIGAQGAGTRGFSLLMNGFADRPPGQQDAVCRTWFKDGTAYLGHRPVSVRIYELTWQLSQRRGDTAAPPRRTLAWTCTERGADAVD